MQIEEIHEYLGLGMVMEDDLIDTAIELEALEAWSPFEDPNRVLYKVNAQKRDQHFRKIVLRNYQSTCAVTGQHFELNDMVEAQAAHIISKEKHGSDNPKNGLALSRSVHWAFDQGIFTVTDQFEVLIHPKAKSATVRNFPLFEQDRKQIHLPKEQFFLPHQEALQWHRDEVYGKFAS
jgi:predicted restriction endonuclease